MLYPDYGFRQVFRIMFCYQFSNFDVGPKINCCEAELQILFLSRNICGFDDKERQNRHGCSNATGSEMNA